MKMSATKGQINWSGCVFASTNIVRVSNVSVSQGGALLAFKGDTDVYDSIVAVVEVHPTISITTADPGVMMGFSPGQRGSLTVTHKDANGASGGDIIFVLSTAVFETADDTGAHAQFGTATGSWKSVSADGLTNPLSFTRA
jgi:hypothetical protein